MIVASSFEQARISFEHVLAFMGPKVRDRATVEGMGHGAASPRKKHRETGARVRWRGVGPQRAHGLAPVLVLADEPAQGAAHYRGA